MCVWKGGVCGVMYVQNVVKLVSTVNIDEVQGGGRTRLPKFKFSAKFPIGLHVILQIQIKKNRK